MLKNILKPLMVLVLGCVVGMINADAAKRALLIGISDYPRHGIVDASWNKIHGANDVKLISPTLKKQGFQIRELLNAQASAANIKRELAALSKRCTKGDMVYIHFSGHGQPFEDKSGDETDGWDEAIIPYDAHARYHKNYKGQNHIIDDELEKAIDKIRKKVGPKGFVYVVLDACHMGGSSRDESESEEELYIRGTDRGFTTSSKRYVPKIDRRSHMKVKKGSQFGGVCYIEACRAYQTNAEIKENGFFYGPLTFYINRALKAKTLTSNTQWTEGIIKDMAKDRRLVKQNPVIETDR